MVNGQDSVRASARNGNPSSIHCTISLGGKQNIYIYNIYIYITAKRKQIKQIDKLQE